MSLWMMYRAHLMGCRALLICGLSLQCNAPHSNTLQHSATLSLDVRSLAGLFQAGAPHICDQQKETKMNAGTRVDV